MKKHLLIALLFILSLPSYLHAQTTETEDVIYLKNGSVYRGVIIEQEPEKSYKIEIYGGSVIYIKYEDVTKVTKEPTHVNLNGGNAGSYTPYEREPVRRHTLLNVETTLSCITYFTGVAGPFGDPVTTAYGGGITVLPEIHKEGKSFSLLIGGQVQLISARSYTFSETFEPASGIIYRGFQTRFQMPLWFRWTFGQRKTKGFFQFGWSIGGNYYQGRGERTVTDYINYYLATTYGHQHYLTGSMNISPLGVGIRHELWKNIQLVAYVEGAPINLEFTADKVYHPYLQVHVGFNFGTARKKTTKK